MKAWQYVEKGWCQGGLAIDNNGVQCSIFSNKAVAWCLIGAMMKVYSCRKRKMLYDKMYQFVSPQWDLVEWNDYHKRTKRQVVALLKKVEGSGRLSDAHGGCRDPRPTTAAI